MSEDVTTTKVKKSFFGIKKPLEIPKNYLGTVLSDWAVNECIRSEILERYMLEPKIFTF